jgi:phenylalanyl-tRNA synthetase alpha chain
MLQKITELLQDVSSVTVKNSGDLELFRLKYLSKKGLLSDLFEDFKNVPPSSKKDIGQKLNLLKQTAQEKYNSLKAELSNIEEGTSDTDLTRPSYPYSLGSRHPISIVRN